MLEIKHLNKSFENNQVLQDISLKFQDRQTTVILGPSGSGKSTLLRSLNLLEIPESGQLLFDDLKIDFSQKIIEEEKRLVRQQTAMVFQSFNLFSHLTAIENVIEGPVQVLKQDKETAIEVGKQLLDQVGLQDKYDSYPSQLSGGQQQRVAIARALAMKPKFLLFDEPTSALDPELEIEVLRVLRNIASTKLSLILVTHNLDFARLVADRIIFLEAGKIQFEGTTETFFNHSHPRIQQFIHSLKLEADDL